VGREEDVGGDNFAIAALTISFARMTLPFEQSGGDLESVSNPSELREFDDEIQGDS